MEVKVNNSEQNINLTLTQGQNPINIQLKPSEPQDISVSLKPKSSPLEFAIATPIVRPIHFGLAPNVIKEIISGGSHLYDLYDVQADGNSVFGALADAVLTYDADGRWKAVLPSELTITKNGDPIGTYKLRGKNQTIDIAVPTLISQLSNDKGYITEEELSIALDSIKGIQFFVVDVLPTPSKDTLSGIYLVRKLSSQSGNYYEEYITITRGGSYVWEKIGDTSINLSGYATKEDLEDAVDKSRGYTDNKNEELKDYVEGVRKDVITSVEDTIQTTTEQIASTQEHLIEVERDLRETSERLDEESERLRNVKAELDGELTLAQIEIDKANASIESVAVKVDESAGTINEVKETLDATNLTLSETVTKLDENTGNITQIRNELNGIDETIVSVIESQVEDEDSKLIQTIGLLVDNKNKEIELAVKAIQEGIDESTVSWVGQKIDAADQEIKTAIETMIYGEGYTETKTIGQVIDGKMDEITTQVLKSEELVGENGVIQQNINGAYTQWGIGSIKNSVSAISGVLSENGELIDVKTKFSTIEQDLGSILLTVGETEDYEGETILEKFAAISLKIDQVGFSVTNGDNYAAIVAQINKEGSEVLIKADKIHLLGETVAEQLTAQSATIGNLTLTNAVVSGTINANAGNIGGWQIGPASAKGTYLYGGNLILSSEGYIKNQQGDKVHFTLNNDGSGSLADGNIWWDNEGALYFSGNAIVVTEDSEASQGKALAQLVSDVSKVLSMFDIDTNNNAVYVKGDRNFYAFGEITALGQGTGGSGGGSGEGGADLLDVWLSIAGNTDAYKDYQVNASHLTAYLTRAQIQETYATKEDLENIDIPTLTESDPIFKASAAYGITSTDIANWNSIRSAIPTSLSDLANDMGYITASAIPTSYAWSAITGKPSFATVATSGSYNDLSNKPSIPSIAGLASESWVSNNFLGLSGNGMLSFDSAGRPVMANNQGYAAYNNNGQIEEVMWLDTSNLLQLGGTTSQKVNIYGELTINYQEAIHSGNYSSYALPLSGGTISGRLDIQYTTDTPLYLKSTTSGNGAYIGFNASDNSTLGYLGITADKIAQFSLGNGIRYNLLHSGNYTNYTIAAAILGGVNANATYNFSYYPVSNGSNVPSGSQYGSLLTLPYRTLANNTTPDFATQLFLPNGDDSASPNDMFFRTSVKNSWNAWQKVITSGNIGSYAPIYNSAGNVLIGTTTDNGAKLYVKDTRTDRLDGNLVIDGSGAAYGYNYMGILLNHNGTTKGSIGWNTVSLSNGADSAGGLFIRNTISQNHINIYNEGGICAYTSSFQTNGNIIAGGNVGIGTTSPAHKLDVNGTANFTSIYTPNANTFNRWCDSYNSYEITQMSNITEGAPSGYPYGYLTTYRWNNGSWSGQMYLTVADFGGEIFTRGFRDDQGKWTIWRKAFLDDGYGNYTASGEITALGSSSSSDRRLKDIVRRPTPLTLEDIAKLNVISFKWNHRENDKRLKIGLVAQEVQEVLPELVGVDRSNYLTLDYSTFGSVVGVLNTKKILSLEEEVIALRDEVKELRRKIYG